MRRRIVTLTVVAAVLAIGLFGLPFALGVAKYYLDDERAELERAADSSALAVSDDLAGATRVPVLPAATDEHQVGLYTPDGRLRAGPAPRPPTTWSWPPTTPTWPAVTSVTTW
jgi:hypothetical protein